MNVRVCETGMPRGNLRSLATSPSRVCLTHPATYMQLLLCGGNYQLISRNPPSGITANGGTYVHSLQSNSHSIFIAEFFIISMTYTYIIIPMGILITGYINSEKLEDCYNVITIIYVQVLCTIYGL